MFSFKPTVRRLVASLVAVIAALSLVSDKAAAVADEDYFIDIYLAAQAAASAKRSTDLIIERGVPPDVASELYRKAQVCYGKVLFKHVTRPEVTYLRTHNDGIRLRAGSGSITPDIQGIIGRSADLADARERARCLWYEADMQLALGDKGLNPAVRDFKCRHVRDADFVCTYWVDSAQTKAPREEREVLYRWDDGWSAVQR
ncbi:hypothetical protein [Hyphomicrobium sp. D-2]|uniref:hypothetical protein n=1 Tax=Hyphomicrobium sp. D-2 TaxID=3041621 RepID=UPI002453FF17|nr:hypothetical protein [Hyphomicrobium sp. D-2]MDH4980964.1 hypothetical protein [Hyphomicrobium sp. D-2]